MGRENIERHHIIPLSRGGSDTPDNIISVSHKRHWAYHYLFGDKPTPLEVIIKVHKMIGSNSPALRSQVWRTLFGERTVDQVIKYLQQVWFKGKLQFDWRKLVGGMV